eukprot:4432183-Amphidinium_carterae.1
MNGFEGLSVEAEDLHVQAYERNSKKQACSRKGSVLDKPVCRGTCGKKGPVMIWSISLSRIKLVQIGIDSTARSQKN